MSRGSRLQKKLTVCNNVDESVPQQVETPKIQMALRSNLLISLGIGPIGQSPTMIYCLHDFATMTMERWKTHVSLRKNSHPFLLPVWLKRSQSCSHDVSRRQICRKNIMLPAGGRQEVVGGALATRQRAKCSGASSRELRQMCDRRFPKLTVLNSGG